MPSNAVTERDDRATRPLSDIGRYAPSVIVEDEPTTARWIGFVGTCLVLVATVTLISRLYLKREVLLVATSASIALVLGLAALLFHAAFERDTQLRRVYLFAGALGLVIGA